MSTRTQERARGRRSEGRELHAGRVGADADAEMTRGSAGLCYLFGLIALSFPLFLFLFFSVRHSLYLSSYSIIPSLLALLTLPLYPSYLDYFLANMSPSGNLFRTNAGLELPTEVCLGILEHAVDEDPRSAATLMQLSKVSGVVYYHSA